MIIKIETMKKLFYFAFFILSGINASAQIRINLVLLPTPPANLSEWASRKEVLTLVVTGQNPSGGTPEVKIKTEIKTTDGTVIGTTDLAKARVFTFSSATTVLSALEVLPLENMIFTGKYRTALNKTGKLPADNYTLCVQLVRPADFVPVTEQQCRNFYLANTQLPILMKPYNEEVLDARLAQTAITFRWTPVTPVPKEPVTYRIQVFEVLENQSPVQALRANQPLLDREVRGMTQYIWQPQLSFVTEIKPAGEDENPELRAQNNNTVKSNRGTEYRINENNDTVPAPNTRAQNNNTVKSNRGTEYRSSQDGPVPGMKRFIWTIQSLDVNGQPVNQTDGSGEARSEPLIFFVNPATAPAQKIKERPSKGLKDTLKTQV